MKNKSEVIENSNISIELVEEFENNIEETVRDFISNSSVEITEPDKIVELLTDTYYLDILDMSAKIEEMTEEKLLRRYNDDFHNGLGKNGMLVILGYAFGAISNREVVHAENKTVAREITTLASSVRKDLG